MLGESKHDKILQENIKMGSGLAGRKKYKLITLSATKIGKMSENKVLQQLSKSEYEKAFENKTWKNLNLRLDHIRKMKVK